MSDQTAPSQDNAQSIDDFLGAEQRPRWRRWVRARYLVPAVILIVLLLVLSRCMAGTGQPNYVTEDVVRRSLDVEVTATGNLRPTNQVDVGSETSGRVDAVYVDANFKEGQLQKVKPGQKVVLTSDLYGGDVEYHGRVAGFSGGTGAAFALIPAQNATGNWIKVVQRLPVRVTLDPKELAEHPLRVGLSMTAEIDTSAR